MWHGKFLSAAGTDIRGGMSHAMVSATKKLYSTSSVWNNQLRRVQLKDKLARLSAAATTAATTSSPSPSTTSYSNRHRASAGGGGVNYRDDAATLKVKARIVADMVIKSNANAQNGGGGGVVAVTGREISRAAGIRDFAAETSGRVDADHLEAQPTIAHKALAAMGEEGYLDHWVEQNHDCLALKAGMDPSALNEIDGAWGDATIPLVASTESVPAAVPAATRPRPDLSLWMDEWAARADLCLLIGGGSGGNTGRSNNGAGSTPTPSFADDVINECAKRCSSGGGGLVVIGTEKTSFDCKAIVKFYRSPDDVMAAIMLELNVQAPSAACVGRGVAGR